MENNNSQSTAGIIIDYRDVLSKAEEMEKMAGKMEATATEIMQEWNSLRPWSGVVAEEYKQKVTRFCSRLQQEAKGLKFTADVLRTIAETLRAADVAAKRIAESRSNIGG